MAAGASERAARAALLVTGALALTKLAVWLTTNSLSVLSQALDSLVDVVALALVVLGVRIAGKPADQSHHYGHSKAENLVAFTQTIFLGIVVLGIVIEASRRLTGSASPVEAPWYSLVLLGASAVIDAVRAHALARTAREEGSEALFAGAVNIATDVGTALVALISLLLVRSGIPNADAVGGILVGVAVAFAAARVGRRSVNVLMDHAPEMAVRAIEDAASRAAGVHEMRRVRVRGTRDQLFADVTIAAGRTSSLERAHDITEAVELEIEKAVPGTDVVVHVEPFVERSGLGERVQAAASRVDGVHEVHNVAVHAFDEAGRSKLHITLHAKADPALSLQAAHDLADLVEATVVKEIGGSARVDAHIEPLTGTSLGRDVTQTHAKLVTQVRAAALEEPDVHDCHEVLVTAAADGLSVLAHVRGRRDLPLTRIHAASERIENAIHAAHPEVSKVLIHFEPEGAD